MGSSVHSKSIAAVRELSHAVRVLRELGVIRSRRFTGDLGEWYVCQLYGAQPAASQTQKGWDVNLPASGERIQVKTQSYDRENRWNYLDSLLSDFDRLVVVIITDFFTIRALYDVPAEELGRVLRIGAEKKPAYYWDDLEPWKVNALDLPGGAYIAALIESEARNTNSAG